MNTRYRFQPILPTHQAGRLRLVIALAALAAGCATLGDRGQALVPTRYQVRSGQFLIFSDSPVPAEDAAIRCLHALESDLASRLACHAPADEEPVEIYLLNDRNTYTHFLRYHYPELPARRAFFLAQGRRRVVYTYRSDRLEVDLRHEATHALVRGCYGDLPLWLDEGLAEYFETRGNAIGAADEHLARIPHDRKEGWRPDLARLESLSDIHEMTPRDYREAWAWVHLMLNDPRDQGALLLDYLKKRPWTEQPHSLARILDERGANGDALLAYLDSLEARVLARRTEPSPQERLIRFQDRAPEPRDAGVMSSSGRTPPAPQRLSLLRRLGSLLGF